MNAQVNQPTAETFALWREIAEIGIDTRAVMQEMIDEADDFEVDGYRFINRMDIDQIQQDELSGDEYILGCFNAWFLADILNVDTDTIESMQQAEAYEGIGKLIIGQGLLPELQQKYSAADGYGHHFSHYDGSEQEIGDYYVFRVN